MVPVLGVGCLLEVMLFLMSVNEGLFRRLGASLRSSCTTKVNGG